MECEIYYLLILHKNLILKHWTDKSPKSRGLYQFLLPENLHFSVFSWLLKSWCQVFEVNQWVTFTLDKQFSSLLTLRCSMLMKIMYDRKSSEKEKYKKDVIKSSSWMMHDTHTHTKHYWSGLWACICLSHIHQSKYSQIKQPGWQLEILKLPGRLMSERKKYLSLYLCSNA